MEEITLKGKRNLEGRLWLPPNARKAVVVAHSFRNNMNEPACSDAERKFAGERYAVLTFNLTGHGQSEGRLRDLSYGTVSEDVASAIKYMRERGFSKTGAYAISLGTIASVLSSERPDSQVFLSPTPLYYPKGLLERYSESIDTAQMEREGYSLAMSGSGRGSFEIGKAWIEEMRREKGEVRRTHVQNRTPTLIIQGTEDEAGIIKGRRFHGAPTDEYIEVRGADHNFNQPEQRKVAIDKALNWFDKTL